MRKWNWLKGLRCLAGVGAMMLFGSVAAAGDGAEYSPGQVFQQASYNLMEKVGCGPKCGSNQCGSGQCGADKCGPETCDAGGCKSDGCNGGCDDGSGLFGLRYRTSRDEVARWHVFAGNFPRRRACRHAVQRPVPGQRPRHGRRF